MYMIHYSMTI